MSTKRHFLKTAGGALAGVAVARAGVAVARAGVAVARAGVAVAEMPGTVVDTHTHFYDPTRPGGVPWPQQDSPLFRIVLPDDWRAVAKPCGVTHTVVVEASPLVEDNQWILDLAAQDTAIVGFVGNLDPMDAAFGKHLKRFAASPVFRGIRVSGKRFYENAEREDFIRAMSLMADMGLSLDVNGPHPTLPKAASLADKIPALRLVVDHVGSAGDPGALTGQWRDGMKQAGQCANIYCKVSGLPEQTKAEWGKARSDLDYYRPVLDHVWECFGGDRVIYGSNWPVSDRGVSYGAMFAMVRSYFAGKGAAVLRKYFLENSAAAYRWVARK